MSTITINDKRNQLVDWLKKELGSVHNVKEFSETIRYLELGDLRDDKEFTRITDDGGAVLLTLVSWYSLGLLSKLKEIKQKIKEEK